MATIKYVIREDSEKRWKVDTIKMANNKYGMQANNGV